MNSRPKKSFRGELVAIGFEWGADPTTTLHTDQNQQCLKKLVQILEDLHLASLIVDDIEDSSHSRRGAPCLHQSIGLPLALNAGNWLYFRALTLTVELPESQRSTILEVLLKGLERGHLGQALDLGQPIWNLPQHEVPAYVLHSLNLKSGVLMGMSLESGAVLARGLSGQGNLSLEERNRIRNFGERLGTVLQMWDDSGNFRWQDNTSHQAMELQKYLEDFSLGRPTWIWHTAAQEFSARNYENFSRMAREFASGKNLSLFATAPWLELMKALDLQKAAQKNAQSAASDLIQSFTEVFPTKNVGIKLQQLLERITCAYI